ncbi:hypothetical protein KEM55_007327 [Ascosphaera atra]|nr:hypothetical protein KEM55_007327 [Ascosphaera atra]
MSSKNIDEKPQDLNRSDEETNIESSPPLPPQPDPFPEGGLDAWLCVLGGFLAMFCSFGWINCMGVFQDYYETHQLKDLPSTTISWISSVESCMMFFVGPFCGQFFDHHGPRLLLLVGTFMHVFGLMMASLSSKLYQFILAQAICSGIGAGLLFWPVMTSLLTWFLRRRALAVGIATAGSGLGGVCLPIAVERMIPEIGYPWTMRTCGFIILALCIVVNLSVKSRLPPRKQKFDPLAYIKPFKERTFFFTALGILIFGFALFIPFNYIILFGRKVGMSNHLAQYLPSILNSASIFGRVLAGALADRVGRYNTMFVVCILCGIWTLAMWIPASGNALTIVFALFYGFTSGAFVSLPAALVGQISHVKEIGVRTGSLFVAMSIGALTGNPIGGALIDDPLSSSYWKIQVSRSCGNFAFRSFKRNDNTDYEWQVFAGVMMIGGAFGILLGRISQVGVNPLTVF